MCGGGGDPIDKATKAHYLDVYLVKGPPPHLSFTLRPPWMSTW